MDFFCDAVEAALRGFFAAALGRSLCLRPSQKAMLASPDYVRGGSEEAAKRLSERLPEAALFGARLLRAVHAENGWLLFDLAPDAVDAYALRLPHGFAHGDAYIDRRMELLLRHGDRPLCDCDSVVRAVWLASLASRRGRWTQDDERAVLSMTHGLKGMARVEAEQRAARAARIILFERRNLL